MKKNQFIDRISDVRIINYSFKYILEDKVGDIPLKHQNTSNPVLGITLYKGGFNLENLRFYMTENIHGYPTFNINVTSYTDRIVSATMDYRNVPSSVLELDVDNLRFYHNYNSLQPAPNSYFNETSVVNFYLDNRKLDSETVWRIDRIVGHKEWVVERGLISQNVFLPPAISKVRDFLGRTLRIEIVRK